jgi:hypothetical protein
VLSPEPPGTKTDQRDFARVGASAPELPDERTSVTAEERAELVAHLRVAWGETNEALAIAAGHKGQWPELTKELDQTLTRLTRHLALAEKLHLKGKNQ